MLHGDPVLCHFHFRNLSIAPGVLDFHRKFKLKPEGKNMMYHWWHQIGRLNSKFRTKKNTTLMLHYQHALKKKVWLSFCPNSFRLCRLCYFIVTFSYVGDTYSPSLSTVTGALTMTALFIITLKDLLWYSLNKKHTSLPVVTLLNQRCWICRNAIVQPPTEV